jgi:cellulose synthase/poly-beta-1,6-N-acetylglucosamine synthase-like glycosyltransferase
MPRFSVLVPTRDRPDLLGFCLEALAQQTFPDLEVIVADNPVKAPARDVYERWRKDGWHYVRAPEPIPMHDNWELGVQHASGEFQAVVIDKTILQPSALELANRALEHDPGADLVSWWNDGYDPDDEAGVVGDGILIPTPETREAERFDPTAELQKMFSLDQRRGEDPIHYFRGKIVFGAYSQTLLTRIREACGQIFYPLSPDYTSRIPALALTRGAIDVGRPLLVSYNSRRSNGRRTASNASYAKSFVLGAQSEALPRLPIPGLYTSIHNLVAYDCVTCAARLGPKSLPGLDRANLVRRAREDLELVSWESESERDDQFALLEAEEARLGVVPPVVEPIELAQAPPTPRGAVITRVARGVRRRIAPPEPTPVPQHPIFHSPVAAAVAADRLYTSVGGGITL